MDYKDIGTQQQNHPSDEKIWTYFSTTFSKNQSFFIKKPKNMQFSEKKTAKREKPALLFFQKSLKKGDVFFYFCL